MAGRIKRKLQAQKEANAAAWAQAHPVLDEPICPLCGRPIPASEQDAHHWLPKSKGGKATTLLHRICHRHLHALFSETELAHTYNTPETLLTQPEVVKFVAWVKTKPNDFSERTQRSKSWGHAKR